MPLERLFSGPRSQSVYLNTTRQTLPLGYAVQCQYSSPTRGDTEDTVVTGQWTVQFEPAFHCVHLHSKRWQVGVTRRHPWQAEEQVSHVTAANGGPSAQRHESYGVWWRMSASGRGHIPIAAPTRASSRLLRKAYAREE